MSAAAQNQPRNRDTVMIDTTRSMIRYHADELNEFAYGDGLIDKEFVIPHKREQLLLKPPQGEIDIQFWVRQDPDGFRDIRWGKVDFDESVAVAYFERVLPNLLFTGHKFQQILDNAAFDFFYGVITGWGSLTMPFRIKLLQFQNKALSHIKKYLADNKLLSEDEYNHQIQSLMARGPH